MVLIPAFGLPIATARLNFPIEVKFDRQDLVNCARQHAGNGLKEAAMAIEFVNAARYLEPFDLVTWDLNVSPSVPYYQIHVKKLTR